MRGRTASMVDVPLAQKLQSGKLGQGPKHSISSSALNKMEFSEKVERYKVLLEREFELRTQLTKQYAHSSCAHHRHSGDDVTVVCDCGRKISHFYNPALQLNNFGFLTPPTNRVRYRSYSDKVIKAHRARPLSADVHLEAPSSVTLRKMATEERMGKRRQSLKSLETDFEKAKVLIQRAKVGGSNTSLDGESSPRRTESINELDTLDIKRNVEITNKNLAIRRKERPLSSYL